MTKLIFIISALMLVGSLFILASLKSRSSLDTPLLSNNAKFIIGFMLVFAGICITVVMYLKGAF
jgi:hypothetical protein